MAAPSVGSLEFLKQTYGNKLKTTKNNLSLQLGKNEHLTGISSIAKNFQRQFDNGLSLEERMAVEQWLDYSCDLSAYENAGDRESVISILKDLNSYLKDKVYFVGSDLTVADVFLCHNLYTTFAKLTFSEKERLIHLSRWFNHVQNDARTKQSLLPVKFLRTLLYSGVGNH